MRPHRGGNTLQSPHLGCILLGALHVIHVVQEHFDGLALQVELLVDLECLLEHLVPGGDFSDSRAIKVVKTMNIVLHSSAISLHSKDRQLSMKIHEEGDLWRVNQHFIVQ